MHRRFSRSKYGNSSSSFSLQEYFTKKNQARILFVDLVVLFCQNPISSPRLNFRRIHGSNNSLQQRRKVNYPRHRHVLQMGCNLMEHDFGFSGLDYTYYICSFSPYFKCLEVYYHFKDYNLKLRQL